MTSSSIHRLGTIGAALAVTSLAGCASWWSNNSQQPSSQSQAAPISAYQAPEAPAEAVPPPLSPGLIKRVQATLHHDGYYRTGRVDGLWGPKTETAVERFQSDHNLRPSGQLDSPTLEAMNIPVNTPNGPGGPPPNERGGPTPNGPGGPTPNGGPMHGPAPGPAGYNNNMPPPGAAPNGLQHGGNGMNGMAPPPPNNGAAPPRYNNQAPGGPAR